MQKNALESTEDSDREGQINILLVMIMIIITTYS